MKKNILLSFASLALIMSSCSKDDTTVPSNPVEENTKDIAINAQEETVLNADMVSSNIIISGAKKVKGTPPTPNGAISLTLEYDQQTAFQKNGFDINFKAPDNYAGAYIQLKSQDGTLSKEYIDVSRFAFKKAKKTDAEKTNGFLKKSIQVDEIETEIDVDFGESIPAGKFCYIICIYDNENNISLPQEVCVEVEAWGGNSALVDTWNNTKSENFLNGEPSDTETVGVTQFNDTNYYCDKTKQTETLENSETYTTKSLILVLNQDGSYRYDELYDQKRLDYEKTIVDCNPTFNDEKDLKDYGKGKWAYNEDTKELTLIEFEYNENGNLQILEEGDVVFSGATTVSGNSMILESSNSFFDGQQTSTYSSKVYFVR